MQKYQKWFTDSPKIFWENISQWLVFRGKLVNQWKKFFHPTVKWIDRNNELCENKEETKRYNEMINMFQEVFDEKILLDYDQLEDPEFVDDLTSFNGQKLDSKDILRSYDIGKSDYEEFVETRLKLTIFSPRDLGQKNILSPRNFGLKNKLSPTDLGLKNVLST